MPKIQITQAGWKTVALGEVAKIERSAIQPEAISQGTSYLGLEHIESGGKILGAKPVDEGELASSKFKFTDRHLLYGKLRPYLAKIALPDFAGICSTDILPILPSSCLDRRYLCYFLRQPLMVDYANSRASGANLPRLSPSALAEFEIPLPPLAEQRRIAEVLDRAEALRAKRRAALAQLDSLTQSLFLDLFGKPKDNPNRWPIVALMDVCSPKQWPTISTSDLTLDGYPVFGANGQIGFYTKYNHEHPTVLVTCRGATCGTINVCPPKCYVTGNAMALDDPDPKKIDIAYLEHVLRIRGMADTISGTAQPQITRQGLHPVKFPLPPIALQREFARRVSAVEALKTSHRASLAELNTLFASLQHRAFRGEL